MAQAILCICLLRAFHGDIQEHEGDVIVLVSKLFMHKSSDLTTEVIHTLTRSECVKFLDAQNGALLVSDAEGSPSGEVRYIEGWIDERFAVLSSQYYIAMHPTPVYIAPASDAKIVMLLDTYDSLSIVDEQEDFYSVVVNGGIGYVEKEVDGL